MSRQSPSVKRLLKEAKQMQAEYDPDGDIEAAPSGDGDNLFDWLFTIRGPSDSAFEEGIYRGRLLFPPQYPMKPPDIFLLTPNGRFETNKKICLSISGYHPETWLPSWSVSTALRALQAFFLTPAKGAIGGLEWPDSERKRYAKLSQDWECKRSGQKMNEILNVKNSDGSKTVENSVPAEISDENNNKIDDSETKSQISNENLKIEDKNFSGPKSALGCCRKRDVSTKKQEGEAEVEQSQSNKREEIRKIEQTIIRQQLEYQKSDMMSLVFMVILFVLVAVLLVRKVNKVSVEGTL